jgi:hypothetical protein
MALDRDFVERVQVLAQSRDLSILLDLVVERYLEEWRTSPPEKAERREYLYRMVQAVEALKKEVQTIAVDEYVTAHNSRLKQRTYRPDSW